MPEREFKHHPNVETSAASNIIRLIEINAKRKRYAGERRIFGNFNIEEENILAHFNNCSTYLSLQRERVTAH